MSLEIMAGPIQMTPDPDDSAVGGTAHFGGGARCIWLDYMGWFGRLDPDFTGGGNTGFITCNLDGVTRLRADIPSAFGVTTMNQDELTGKVTVHYSSGDTYLMNPLVGGLEPQAAVNSMTEANLRTNVGWFKMSGTSITRAPLDATGDGDYVTEYAFTPTPSSGSADRLVLGPDNLIYWYTGGTNGVICAYDTVLKTEVFPNPNGTGRWTLGAIYDTVFYSRKFDTFMIYDDVGAAPGELYVFSTELGPSALSVPTASPAVAAGVVSTISVTLTDDQSVGIVGRLIDWSITVGNGVLLDTQTTTDADGIATTLYRAPITGGVNPTIQASLTY